MKFWEAAAVRAAVAYGGADSVFIHSLDVSLIGRSSLLSVAKSASHASYN
jgi:hypothetical protein